MSWLVKWVGKWVGSWFGAVSDGGTPVPTPVFAFGGWSPRRIARWRPLACCLQIGACP